VRARVCRPQIGRWIGRDPRRQHRNFYSYGGNRPQLNVDPSGLWIDCGPCPDAHMCGQAALQVTRRQCIDATKCPHPKPAVKDTKFACDPRLEADQIRERLAEIAGITQADWSQAEDPTTVWYACTGCCCTGPNCRGVCSGFSRFYVCDSFPSIQSGCVKNCLIRHESEHAGQCGTQNMTMQQAEIGADRQGGAYGEERKCLEAYLATIE